MSTIRHILGVCLLVAGVACTESAAPRDHDRLTRIVAETVLLNQQQLPPDSLAARRQSLLTNHDVDEQQLRQWIESLRSDPELTTRTATRVATLVDSLSTTTPR